MELHTALPSAHVAMGIGKVWCAVCRGETGDKIPLYFIEHEDFYYPTDFSTQRTT
jgi:hypothetical protein